MRGAMKNVVALLGLLLLSVACGAKKLWGVDVGKKEEAGEFERLLQRAGQPEGQLAPAAGIADDVAQALAALADADLTKLSLSELCTSLIDVVIETVQDEEWLGQFAEPGVLGGLFATSGLGAVLGEDGVASVEKDDLLELISLEGSPILYKTKFYELAEKTVGKLVKLRMEVSDPATLRAMLKDVLTTAGLDREQIKQVMEIVEHPEMLAAQINALLSDPTVVQELTKAAETLFNAASVFEDSDLDSDEMMQMLAALEEDPALMEEMYAELMKDPAFVEALKAEGGEAGDAGGFFKGMGARPGGIHTQEL